MVVTDDNDSVEKQKDLIIEEQYCSLPEGANQPGSSNIQEKINLPDPLKQKKDKKNISTQMRVKLLSVASICDRTGILDGAFAAITSAVL